MKLNKLWIPILVIAGCAIIAGGCKKKVDLTETETAGVTANTANKSNITSKITETTTAPKTAKAAVAKKTIEATTKSYQDEKVNISYPEITGLKDEKLTGEVNERIQKNATSIIEAMKLDPSTTSLEIQGEIISSTDKRVTIAYTGKITQADGTVKNVFFTNTINATTGKDMGLSDFVDPQTMAGYILSNDVKLYQASEELTKKFFDTRHKLSYDDYLAILTASDFPLDTDAEGKVTGFPQSFSYEKNGDIYFTIPVSSEMGDYVIIKYSPDSK